MTGFIKDYRQELDSDVWLMPPIYHRVWQYLKYKVNHEPNEIPMRDGSKFKIYPGQHLTSVRNICKDVGWYERGIFKEPNPKTIKAVLDWLQKNGMIAVDQGNRKYTLVTLINWAIYQEKRNKSNSKGTESNHSMDINKNEYNEKELKPSCHKFEICDMENAKLLFELMQKNNPSVKQPNFNKWANDFRLMRERDNRNDEQIKYLINWSQHNDFWQTNILSPGKLRKQWEQLVLKAKKEYEQKQQIKLGEHNKQNNVNWDELGRLLEDE